MVPSLASSSGGDGGEDRRGGADGRRNLEAERRSVLGVSGSPGPGVQRPAHVCLFLPVLGTRLLELAPVRASILVVGNLRVQNT